MSTKTKRLHILVGGLRGIGNVEGGVEQHAQQLYPRLVELGYDVTVIARSPYVPAHQKTWQGVRIKRIWSPTRTGIEAFLHTFLATLYAVLIRPDVYHLHAVGPGIFAPLARLFGIRVVFTHHGPDYDREKWGPAVRRLLQQGENWGCRSARRPIVISRTIADLVHGKYGLDAYLIPNGVEKPPPCDYADVMTELNLTPRRFVLQVSRIVPEKRQIDLIKAFDQADLPGWQLVFAGTLDESAYSQELQSAAAQRDHVQLLGFVTGHKLQSLLHGAGIFVLPSSHEGLPIALLEALSYGAQTIASDIPANLEVGLGPQHYFPLGDTVALAQRLEQFSQQPFTQQDKANLAAWVTEQYNWDNIARQTADVYADTLKT